MKLDLTLPVIQLKRLYTAAKRSYYESGESILTDAQFDKLEDFLRLKVPSWSGFKTGAPVAGKKTKVTLPVPMGSLDKAKTEKAVQGFIDEGVAIVVMDKLDGSSLQLIYEGGVPVQLITRGNGKIGGDISFLIPHLRGIPERIVVKKRVIVRCEGLFSKQAFLRYKGQPGMDADRNAASGILNRQDVHHALKDLSLLALQLMEPNVKPSQGLAWLKAQGFKTVAWKRFDHESVSFEMLSRLLQKRKAEGHYRVDGLVLTWDRVNQQPKSGNPVWSLAFKENLQTEDAPRTTITGIVWKVSPHGYIIPKFTVEPTLMPDGVTVRNCSAKNIRLALQMGTGVGAQIGLVRSGDIIPMIVKVYKKAKFLLPSPDEFGPYHWDTNKVNIVLDNPKDNEEFRAAKITRTFANLDIDFLRGATVVKLIDAGFDSVSRILRATVKDFLQVPGWKQATADRLWNALHPKTDEGFPLTQLMDASGVFPRGMGQTLLDKIAEHHNLMELASLDRSEVITLLCQVDGFQTTSASKVADGLPRFLKWMKQTGLTVRPVKPLKIKLDSQKLSGLGITWTGFRDAAGEALVVKNGGRVVPFGGKTSILIVSPNGKASTKAAKAEQKGIPVMLWNEFIRKYHF